MKQLGPPEGCSCDNYFELNGAAFHERKCLLFDPETMNSAEFDLDALESQAEEERVAIAKELDDLS